MSNPSPSLSALGEVHSVCRPSSLQVRMVLPLPCNVALLSPPQGDGLSGEQFLPRSTGSWGLKGPEGAVSQTDPQLHPHNSCYTLVLVHVLWAHATTFLNPEP